MKTKKILRSNVYALATLLFVAVFVLQATVHQRIALAAGQLTARSMTLQDGVDGPDADTIVDGGSQPGGVVNHYFQFTTATSGNISSIRFEYCTTANPATTCVTPNGLDTTSGTMTIDQTGSGITGFTLVNNDPSAPNGSPYITLASPFDASLPTAVKIKLVGVTNPDTTNCYQLSVDPAPKNNCTFFVRITTYSSTDASAGSEIDQGTVAFSTATPILLSGYMPESLVFCTGGSIAETNNVPDCAKATSGSIAFPDFSPTVTSYTTSQMAASTNAGAGYAITVSGATMTSGSNTVTAVSAAADTCKPGTSQFALNLVQNTNFCGVTGQTVGNNVTTPTGGSTYNGQAIAPFSTDGSYKFTPNALNNVADSNSSGTDAQTYTVTYIVNVPGSQPAGTYTTTLTYICTPTF